MSLALELADIYLDEDIVEDRVRASSGRFSGVVVLCANHQSLKETATRLEGFPGDPNDACQIDLGSMSPEFAGGGLRLHLSCDDRTEHSRHC